MLYMYKLIASCTDFSFEQHTFLNWMNTFICRYL